MLAENGAITDPNYDPDAITYGSFTWEVRSDMLDLDGDGIPEGVSFGDSQVSGGINEAHIATPSLPPRLMVGINNGRGAQTSVSYASVANTNVVQRDPGIVMPVTEWVVASLTTVDNEPTPNATTSTTSYVYKDPVFSAEGDVGNTPGNVYVPPPPQRKYAFRGFEQVTATDPSRAQAVQRYDYSVDWSGRLKTTLVVPAEAPTTVTTIDETTWTWEGLFCTTNYGCPIKTYHALDVDHYICSNGQSETACRASGAFTRTASTLSLLSSTTDSSGPYLWKETSARLQTSTTPQNGDRVTDSTYVLVADANNYRLLPQTATQSLIVNGAESMYAKTAHCFNSTVEHECNGTVNTPDPTSVVALTDEVWVDTVDDDRAILVRGYDMTTGNVVSREKPVQHAGDGAATTYTYDSRLLFVATTTLEPAGINHTGQVIKNNYEYGTGTKIETIGPSIAPCYYYQQGCPSGSPPRRITSSPSTLLVARSRGLTPS